MANAKTSGGFIWIWLSGIWDKQGISETLMKGLPQVYERKFNIYHQKDGTIREKGFPHVFLLPPCSETNLRPPTHCPLSLWTDTFHWAIWSDAGTMLMLKVTEILLDQRSRRIVTDYRHSLLERLFYTWVELLAGRSLCLQFKVGSSGQLCWPALD